jgi:hypothetical protein
MQHINCLSKPDGIYGAIGIATMVLNNLRTPGPSPFHGLALGCFPPNCATLSALPMPLRTASGKDIKSSLDEPAHMSGFSLDARMFLVIYYPRTRILGKSIRIGSVFNVTLAGFRLDMSLSVW